MLAVPGALEGAHKGAANIAVCWHCMPASKARIALQVASMAEQAERGFGGWADV